MAEKHLGHETNSTDLSLDHVAGSRPDGLTGWKYKQLKLGSLRFPWYGSPAVQLLLVAFVCFMCPGMFNALGGLGGGGQINPSAADKANVALYSTFAVVGESASLPVPLCRRCQQPSNFPLLLACTLPTLSFPQPLILTRFLRWIHRQHYRHQTFSLFRRSGLLRVYRILSLLQPHSECWLQHFRWRAARCLCGHLVDSTGCHHASLSA